MLIIILIRAVTKAIAHITKTVVSLPEAEGEEEIDVDGQVSCNSSRQN